MSLADNILNLLHTEGPQTDGQIATTLRVLHQQVNQVCRGLADQKRILRETGGDGLILNRLPGQSAPPRVAPRKVQNQGLLSEDEIKRAVKDHLEEQGYSVQVMWGRSHGIDIEATGQNGRMVIEAKGQVASQQQQTNYFIGALGELIQRMSDPQARYALALPDEPRCRGLASRLPSLARERLNLSILYVRREGDRYIVRDT